MKEYGGYIEFEYYHGKEYHEGAVALNSGRHCVEYLIHTKHIQKLYMPYFMCDSVSALCEKRGVNIEYYHTDISFMPKFEKRLEDGEWLYVVNFYGQLSNEAIESIKIKFGNVIVDNVQDFFRKPLEGVDTVYTCRKFFGVADGGYLYTDVLLEEEIPDDISYDRMTFLFGRMEKSANEFYSQYADNNSLLAEEPMKRMSKLTQNLMRGIDYERVKNVRTQNFAYLHEKLENINQLQLKIPEGAFMYPLYVQNGAQIRRELQKQKIYIPTLWPNVLQLCKDNCLEYDMANNILPIPVDQRYGIKDMEHILYAILL